MKTLIKKILKELPPFKQYLARMRNLEHAVMKQIELLKVENTNLEKQLQDKNREISCLLEEMTKIEKELSNIKQSISEMDCFIKTQGKRLDARIDASNNQMNYLYYKGLHSDSYKSALVDWYYQRTGESLNLDNPQTYNEKIQWLKLNDNTELKTRLADKYLVREWVTEKIGEEYLIPLLGGWDRFDEISFDKLPKQFVLKTNHGSGWNLIIKDKDQMDFQQVKSKLDLWMKKNFAFYGLELHYAQIPRKIIAEEYLQELDQVYDYKFMCFNGEVKFIWVDTDRFTGHKRTLYTPEWKKMNSRIHYDSADYDISRPKNFEKMMEIASVLSEGFVHVRVDLYNVNGKIYFGEMTFTSGSGTENIEPKEFALEMGTWITLPQICE